MIPVQAKPEPATFDAEVRQKGLAHLAKKGFPLNQPLPPKADIEPIWRACLTDLHHAYAGVCAYLGVFFERVVGGGILVGAPFNGFPNNALNDGVDSNDVPYLGTFPFLGTPHEGFVHDHVGNN